MGDDVKPEQPAKTEEVPKPLDRPLNFKVKDGEEAKKLGAESERSAMFDITFVPDEPILPLDWKKTQAVMEHRIRKALQAPLPEEAKEKYASGLTGYKSQAYIDRLNEVLGLDGWSASFSRPSVGPFPATEEPQKNGLYFVETVCSLTIETPFLTLKVDRWGSFEAVKRSEALMGAETRAFKRTCRWLGIGRDAYLGSIDEDRPSGDQPAAGSEVTADQLFAGAEIRTQAPAAEKPRSEVKSETPTVNQPAPAEETQLMLGMKEAGDNAVDGLFPKTGEKGTSEPSEPEKKTRPKKTKDAK